MAAQDQLEVIGPSGEVLFFDLDPVKGLTNIGRHPENDIVLNVDGLAAFHAVLDHRQKPYQFVVLSPHPPTRLAGEVLQLNVAREIQTWDTIELDGHSLILVETVAGRPGALIPAPETAVAWPTHAPAAAPEYAPAPSAAAPSAAPHAPAIPAHAQAPVPRTALPADRTDPVVLVEFEARDFALDPTRPSKLDFAVEVEQEAVFEATVINGGDIVATFDLEVQGLDPAWVKINPSQVNLYEGERTSVTVTLSAPRHSSSRAGAHHFVLVVNSPNYPGNVSITGGLLLVRPFYEFAVGDVSPKQQTIAFRKRTGHVLLPIVNRGNSEALFRIEGEDDEHGCLFEFTLPGEGARLARQAELHVPADAMLEIPISITPLARRVVGLRNRSYSYTLTTTPMEGQQTARSVIGQVQSAPLIGPVLIALFLIVVVALVVLIFRPTISYFGADPNLRLTDPVLLTAGESATLRWQASPFAGLRIDPEIGVVPSGSGQVEVAPQENTTYVLRAENLLTRLNQNLFSASREVQVVVDPVLPSVFFTATTPTGTEAVVRGQSVTLSWDVDFAEELILTTNGAPETIPVDQYVGSRVVIPEGDSDFILQARNRYTGQNGVIAKITIRVQEPTGTPLPLPVIQRFDVAPLVITDGVSIKLEWAVSGVDKVSITPLGTDFAPNGFIEVSPKETTTYLLIATNGKDSVQLSRQVIVNPAPTAAPPPEAPKIEFLTVTPEEIVAGSREAANVQLAWSVTGKYTNIEISGPDLGKVSNLDRQGNLTISVEKSTLYILTAFNGELSSSQTVQIKVVVPSPTPTATPLPTPTPTFTPSPTPPPLPVVIFSAAADTGEEPGNVVAVSTGITNTYKYVIVAGTRVKFAWNVSNAVKVIFLNEDKAPQDSTVTRVTTGGTNILTAFNSFGGTTQVFIQIELKARPIPPSPSNVSGFYGPPVTLSWTYDTTSLASINGFRVFRATLPSTSFAPVGDAPKTTPFQYVDNSGACGMAYYVVAVYTGINNEELLTDPSPNSWNSPTCPAASPTP